MSHSFCKNIFEKFMITGHYCDSEQNTVRTSRPGDYETVGEQDVMVILTPTADLWD